MDPLVLSHLAHGQGDSNATCAMLHSNDYGMRGSAFISSCSGQAALLVKLCQWAASCAQAYTQFSTRYEAHSMDGTNSGRPTHLVDACIFCLHLALNFGKKVRKCTARMESSAVAYFWLPQSSLKSSAHASGADASLTWNSKP